MKGQDDMIAVVEGGIDIPPFIVFLVFIDVITVVPALVVGRIPLGSPLSIE
jgi:hypothetical protein